MNRIHVYPNPTESVITIKAEKEFTASDKIVIVTLDGKIVAEISTGKVTQVMIDTKKYNLTSGAYTLLIVNGNVIGAEKLIVK